MCNSLWVQGSGFRRKRGCAFLFASPRPPRKSRGEAVERADPAALSCRGRSPPQAGFAGSEQRRQAAALHSQARLTGKKRNQIRALTLTRAPPIACLFASPRPPWKSRGEAVERADPAALCAAGEARLKPASPALKAASGRRTPQSGAPDGEKAECPPLVFTRLSLEGGSEKYGRKTPAASRLRSFEFGFDFVESEPFLKIIATNFKFSA